MAEGLQERARGAFQQRASRNCKRGGRGLLAVSEVRNHLPLRGKLGWMTPRASVKTTLATKRAFMGLPIPSGSPSFLGASQRG